MIKVLRIITRFNIGGPSHQVNNLYRGMNDDKFETLIIHGKIDKGEGDMSYLLPNDCNKIYIPEMQREIGPKDIIALFKILKVIHDYKPNIIHTHLAKAGMLGRLAGIIYNRVLPKTRRIKLIHTYHGHVFHSYFSRRKTAFFIVIERFLALFTDRVIVISKLQYEDIVNKYKISDYHKTKIIELGLDLKKYVKKNDRFIDDIMFIIGLIFFLPLYIISRIIKSEYYNDLELTLDEIIDESCYKKIMKDNI